MMVCMSFTNKYGNLPRASWRGNKFGVAGMVEEGGVAGMVEKGGVAGMVEKGGVAGMVEEGEWQGW